MRLTNRESDILRACLDLLRLRGITAWRSGNTGVRRTDRKGRAFWAFHGTKGVADISAVVPYVRYKSPISQGLIGIYAAIEVKRPGGVLSADQEAFLAAVRAAGGYALVVSDVRELEAALEEWGVA